MVYGIGIAAANYFFPKEERLPRQLANALSLISQAETLEKKAEILHSQLMNVLDWEYCVPLLRRVPIEVKNTYYSKYPILPPRLPPPNDVGHWDCCNSCD